LAKTMISMCTPYLYHSLLNCRSSRLQGDSQAMNFPSLCAGTMIENFIYWPLGRSFKLVSSIIGLRHDGRR